MTKPLLALCVVVVFVCVWFFWLTHTASISPAMDLSERFEEANSLYAKGDLLQSLSFYQQIEQQLTAQHLVDERLYYNLANVFHQKGELGQAILYYSRAQELNPRDGDLNYNLQLARSQQEDHLQPENAIWLRLADLSREWLTLNELALLSLGLWIIFCFGCWIWWFGPQIIYRYDRFQIPLFILLIFSLVSFYAMGSRIYMQVVQPAAVIIPLQVEISSSPQSKSTTQFILHSGAEVMVLEQRPGWLHIALPGGALQGWTPSSLLEYVQTPK